MTDELKRCRDQIDRIDDDLLALLNRRAELAQQIGHIKGCDATVLRPEREAQVLRRMQEANRGPLAGEAVKQLYTEIMSQCRALEAPVTVAYLGPAGTFTEAAVFKRFGQACKHVPCASIDEVFREVESGEANYGVAPVENSTAKPSQSVWRSHAAGTPMPDVARIRSVQHQARVVAPAIAGSMPGLAQYAFAECRAHPRGEQCRSGFDGRIAADDRRDSR